MQVHRRVKGKADDSCGPDHVASAAWKTGHAADALLWNVMGHLFPFMRLVFIAFLVSYAARVSDNMDSIRISMQERDASGRQA